MRILKYLLTVSVLVTSLSSCLKHNLDELPAWDGSAVSQIQAEFRYLGTNEWVDGNQVVEYKALTRKSMNIDKEALTAKAVFTVPAASGSFTQAIRETVSLQNISCYVDISTAAIIKPLDGAPTLGIPGDWNGTKKYEVKAADGTTSIWTITVTLE